MAELIGEIQLSEPLAGAVLISPWCKFGTDDDSATRNAGSDMVTKKAAHRWSSLFLGKIPCQSVQFLVGYDADITLQVKLQPTNTASPFKQTSLSSLVWRRWSKISLYGEEVAKA